MRQRTDAVLGIARLQMDSCASAEHGSRGHARLRL